MFCAACDSRQTVCRATLHNRTFPIVSRYSHPTKNMIRYACFVRSNLQSWRKGSNDSGSNHYEAHLAYTGLILMTTLSYPKACWQSFVIGLLDFEQQQVQTTAECQSDESHAANHLYDSICNCWPRRKVVINSGTRCFASYDGPSPGLFGGWHICLNMSHIRCPL